MIYVTTNVHRRIPKFKYLHTYEKNVYNYVESLMTAKFDGESNNRCEDDSYRSPNYKFLSRYAFKRAFLFLGQID